MIRIPDSLFEHTSEGHDVSYTRDAIQSLILRRRSKIVSFALQVGPHGVRT